MTDYQLSPFVAVLLAAALIALYLAVYLYRNRDSVVSRWFLATVGALLVWTLAYALELASNHMETMLFWANLQFLAIGAAPLLWYATVNALLGGKRLPVPLLAVGAVVPTVTVILAFGGYFPGFFRGTPETVSLAGTIVLSPDYGPWHNVVFVPYQYLFYALALMRILTEGSRAVNAFRPRYAWLAVAMVLPMLGGLFYVFEIGSFALLNPTAFLLLLSFGTVLWAMRRHQILDVVLLAKDRVLDLLTEAVFVVDGNGEILYANRAANAFAVGDGNSVEGESFGDAMDAYPELILLSQGTEPEEAGFSAVVNHRERFFMAKSTPLTGIDGATFGHTITLSEITDQVLRQRQGPSSLRVVDPSA